MANTIQDYANRCMQVLQEAGVDGPTAKALTQQIFMGGSSGGGAKQGKAQKQQKQQKQRGVPEGTAVRLGKFYFWAIVVGIVALLVAIGGAQTGPGF